MEVSTGVNILLIPVFLVRRSRPLKHPTLAKDSSRKVHQKNESSKIKEDPCQRRTNKPFVDHHLIMKD